MWVCRACATPQCPDLPHRPSSHCKEPAFSHSFPVVFSLAPHLRSSLYNTPPLCFSPHAPCGSCLVAGRRVRFGKLAGKEWRNLPSAASEMDVDPSCPPGHRTAFKYSYSVLPACVEIEYVRREPTSARLEAEDT